jgi:hypothetical protein
VLRYKQILALRQEGDVVPILAWSEHPRIRDVGYVFHPVGSVSRDKLLSTGQTEMISGRIVGIYLFRATDEPATDYGAEPPSE